MKNVEVKNLRATIIQQNDVFKHKNKKIRKPFVVFKGTGKKQKQFLFQMLHAYVNYGVYYKKKLEKLVKQKTTDKEKQKKIIKRCLNKVRDNLMTNMIKVLLFNKKAKKIPNKTIKNWAKIIVSSKDKLFDQDFYEQLDQKIQNMNPDINLLPLPKSKSK